MSDREQALRKEIESYIGGLEPDSIRFVFSADKGLTHLEVVTQNPRHNQFFLFHSVEAVNREEALEKMMDYVKDYKEKESSYTVQWALVGENELHTSYFRARNIMHALDKLYHGREMNSVIVFSVKLNPIA